MVQLEVNVDSVANAGVQVREVAGAFSNANVDMVFEALLTAMRNSETAGVVGDIQQSCRDARMLVRRDANSFADNIKTCGANYERTELVAEQAFLTPAL